MGWMFMFPQNSYFEALSSSVIIFGDWPLGHNQAVESDSHDGISAL